jgi:hypothetical protein
MRSFLRGLVGGEENLPLHGYPKSEMACPLLDALSDDDLGKLNAILPWYCFTTDGRGRRVGRRARPGKRGAPQQLPDRRIRLMHERFGLRDKSVLEFGCFEGVHTIALAAQGAQVTAVDARLENVVKAMVRTALYGQRAAIFSCDLEVTDDWARLPQCDLLHHVGVLYHLKDPVAHLFRLRQVVRVGMMLDTHFALPQDAQHRYETNGVEVAYKRYAEGGKSEIFSGMYDHAKWLTLSTLTELLRRAGFATIEVVEERAERNGPRVLLFAAVEG